MLQSVWGRSLVEYEPQDYQSYSEGKRPDIALHGLGRGGSLLLGDTKVLDPIGTVPARVHAAGSVVGFGNTFPSVLAMVLGLEGQGADGDGQWNPWRGTGYVPPTAGEYANALADGAEVVPLLFETLGGFSASVVKLLERAAAEVDNKLSGPQYDETTWSARSWMSFATQRLSVALANAVAWEAAKAVGAPGLAWARDPRREAAGCSLL